MFAEFGSLIEDVIEAVFVTVPRAEGSSVALMVKSATSPLASETDCAVGAPVPLPHDPPDASEHVHVGLRNADGKVSVTRTSDAFDGPLFVTMIV